MNYLQSEEDDVKISKLYCNLQYKSRKGCTVVSGVDYRVRACDGQKKDASSLRYIVGATAVAGVFVEP